MNGHRPVAPSHSSPTRRLIRLGTLGIVACGLCCAVPLLGLVGGGAALTALACQAEGMVTAAIVAMAAVTGGIWYWKRRRACRIPAAA